MTKLPTDASESTPAGAGSRPEEPDSRGDAAKATIMVEMANVYAPNHPDLRLLKMRASGAAADEMRARQRRAAIPPANAANAASNQAASGREEAIAALLTLPPVTPSTAPKKASWFAHLSNDNPRAVLLSGAFGSLILLVILVVVILAM